MTSTPITWSEMDDNSDPMAQPSVPYVWPNSGDGIYPGKELYGDLMLKPAPGTYVTQFVAAGSTPPESDSSSAAAGAKTIATGLALAFAVLSFIV